MKPQSLSLRRLHHVLDYLIDEHVGIIHHVTELRRVPGAPDFFHFYAQACNTRAFSQQANFAHAGGAAVDRDVARAKAIGEAVERYCSAIYEMEGLPLSSYQDAPFPCVSPSEFALYSPAQYAQPGFPYVPFENSTPVRWAPARDLGIGDTCYVPAAMVFMPYAFDSASGECPIAQRISTGLACHCSLAEAAIAAICEVIERDAFTIAWQAQLGMPQLRLETLSPTNRDLVARLERTGCTVTALNITMDLGVPTILSVLRSGVPEAPALVFAAAAALNPAHAIQKSLEELAHTWRLAQRLKAHLPRLVPKASYDNIREQDDHVHLYCDQANAALADFLFTSRERVACHTLAHCATGDPERDLQVLVEKVQAVHHRVLLVDLTSPDVQELGLAVVRAVIPGFHPLFMGHSTRALGGSRLWEVPQKLGYRGITQASGDNPAPHPYP